MITYHSKTEFQKKYVNVRNYCTYIFHWVYDVCKWEWRQRWQSKGRQYMPRSQPRLWWCLHCPFASKGQCLGLRFRKAFQHLKIDQNHNHFQIISEKTFKKFHYLMNYWLGSNKSQSWTRELLVDERWWVRQWYIPMRQWSLTRYHLDSKWRSRRQDWPWLRRSTLFRLHLLIELCCIQEHL